MVLGLFETGYLYGAAKGFFEYDRGHLSRDVDRMAVRLADAMYRGAMPRHAPQRHRRGTHATDLLATDWFAHADRPLDEVRADYGLPPRSRSAPIAAGSTTRVGAGRHLAVPVRARPRGRGRRGARVRLVTAPNPRVTAGRSDSYFGAPGRTRTCGLVIRSDLLCPLSYGGNARNCICHCRPVRFVLCCLMRPHHTKDKGDVGVAHAIADLADQGFVVLTALCEHAPFDLVGYRDGTFVRVQVKYRIPVVRGAIKVQFCESWSDSRGHVRPADRQGRGRRRVHLLPRHRACYYVDPKPSGPRVAESPTERKRPARNVLSLTDRTYRSMA